MKSLIFTHLVGHSLILLYQDEVFSPTKIRAFDLRENKIIELHGITLIQTNEDEEFIDVEAAEKLEKFCKDAEDNEIVDEEFPDI